MDWNKDKERFWFDIMDCHAHAILWNYDSGCLSEHLADLYAKR